MSLAASFSWNVIAAPTSAGGGSSGGSAPTRSSTGGLSNPLGNGIVRPFRRTARADFATAEGVALVKSDLGQLLGTPTRTIPWRHGFGTDLQPLRHKSNSPILAEMARVRIDQSIRRWMSGVVELRSVRVERVKSDPSHKGKNAMIALANVLIGGKEETIRAPL